MEPESSLPLSQQPATCPYQSQINPDHVLPRYSLKLSFNIIHPLRLGFPSGLVPPSGFLNKTLYSLLLIPIRATCSAHLTSFHMTTRKISGEKKKEKCTLVQTMRLCTGRTAHRGSRGIALLFRDNGTRMGWGVSVTPRPLFTPGKEPVPIVQ